MKKKVIALLLACAMTVPYGMVPVHAEETNETEYSAETEYSTEQEMVTDDGADIQTMETKTGGNINWNYPDNIIPTDVTTAREGCLLVGVKGTYLADAQGVLDLINQYRKEACDNGYPDPRDPDRNLTSSDYVPIKWSSDMEYIARIRAAETGITFDHVRTNGDGCFSIASPNGLSSWGECIAWNGSETMELGVRQWYAEKEDWLDPDSDEEPGHYTAMITPSNTYIGVASFIPESTGLNTTCAEYTDNKDLDETPGPELADCIQTIEIQKTNITASVAGIENTVEAGYTGKAVFQLSSGDCNLEYLLGVTGGAITWSSDNENVVKVDQDGNVIADTIGNATITAETDCSLTASLNITVNKKTTKITETDVTVGECTYTGDVIRPSVVVVCGDKTLQEGDDYTCSYTEALQAGDVIDITVQGIDDYSGTVTKEIQVAPKQLEDNNVDITVEDCYDYTDSYTVAESVVVKCDERTLVPDEDYYISSLSTASNGYTAWIDITVEGFRNYSGAVQRNLTIQLEQKPEIYSVGVKCAPDGLNVAWQSSSNADGYYVYRSRYKNGQWESWKRIKEITNESTASWKDKNVDNSTLYRYTVRAYNESGKSDYIKNHVIESYFVSRPAVKLANGSKGMNVSWSKSKNASGYYIYRKEKKSDSWKKVKAVDSKTTKWTDTDAKAGKQYYYTVVSYRSKSRSAFETDKAMYRLSQPDFTVSSASKGVAVKLKANKSIDGYRIYRKDSNGKWQRVAAVKANKAVTWTDTNVKRNKKYTYTVRSYKKNDASSYHAGKTVTYKGSK